MPEILRSRDCVVFFKGDSQTVVVSQDMVNLGWPGGQGVTWVDSTSDERMVTFSDGLYGGFLVWGSDEDGDRFTAMTQQQPYYKYATFFSGGCLISTSSYERYTYASRLAGPPYVPLVYQANDILYFSKRGLWTNEDELTLSADLRAPCFFTGFVAQVPKAANRLFLGIQTSL
jgi:hypothetical protein